MKADLKARKWMHEFPRYYKAGMFLDYRTCFLKFVFSPVMAFKSCQCHTTFGKNPKNNKYYPLAKDVRFLLSTKYDQM